jgi:zeaxanthin glucosyltransferase
MAALARRLQQRDHKVVIFGIADTEARIRSAGIDFQLIGAADFPLGTLQKLDQRLGELSGLATFRFTVQRVKDTARMVLRDGPEAARNANLDAMLIDEADMGGTVAEHLGLPFVSIAFFPPLVRDDRIPPFCFGWPAGQDPLSRLRNLLGMRLLSRVAAPIFAVVNQQRKAWNLKPLTHATDALSPLAQITQLPQALEFATARNQANLHYTGPFLDNQQRPQISFPWHRLDDPPRV